MRKLLISVLIILLVVLAGFAILEGLSIGSIRVLSVEEIKQANDNLTADISEATTLLKQDYPLKKEELSTAVSELLNEKETYFDLARISTEGEIAKANTEDTYLIEYLWTRVGRHATSKGVNIRMDVKASDSGDEKMKNLAFTVDGQYVGIIQFISALENDDKLNFRVEGFKMVKNEGLLTATFNVNNIRIKVEKTSEPEQTDEEKQDNEDAQNTENTQAEQNKQENTENTQDNNTQVDNEQANQTTNNTQQ